MPTTAQQRLRRIYCTTDMVADFYGVSRDAILKLLQRNREDLDGDSFDVLTRQEVVDKLSMTPGELGMPRRVRRCALNRSAAVR